MASHSLPPQPSRPISTATAAPVKKPLPVKPPETVAEVSPMTQTMTTMTTTPAVNSLSKPGLPSVTPIQIRAPPVNQPVKLQTSQTPTQVQPPPTTSTPQTQTQQQQPQPQQTSTQMTGKQQPPDLTDPVGILPQTLDVSRIRKFVNFELI
mgnify:FL=1